MAKSKPTHTASRAATGKKTSSAGTRPAPPGAIRRGASSSGTTSAARTGAAGKGPIVHRLDLGSSESPARVELKERLAKLSAATSKIGGLKRAINKNFFDVGVILNRIRDEKLYEVKGYGSFEAFVEREIDIARIICLRSARIAEAMTRDVALAAGLERAAAAVAVLDGDLSAEEPSLRPVVSPGPSIPIHKQ
jgi:hypothetical protein